MDKDSTLMMTPLSSPQQKQKFLISPNPKNSQEINPKIYYRTIDEEGKATVIESSIFEVKKNIMGDNDGSLLDTDFDDPFLLNVNENLKFKPNERFYTKIKSFEDER